MSLLFEKDKKEILYFFEKYKYSKDDCMSLYNEYMEIMDKKNRKCKNFKTFEEYLEANIDPKYYEYEDIDIRFASKLYGRLNSGSYVFPNSLKGFVTSITVYNT